jgi:hypothetical protein
MSAAKGWILLTLVSNSGPDRQTVMTAKSAVEVGREWKLIRFPVTAFHSRFFVDVDRATIEFIGEGPTEFFLDDLQLEGRWRPFGLR